MKTTGRCSLFETNKALEFPVFLLMPFLAFSLTLFSSAYLKGSDAYYYALQSDWLFKYGSLRIPDSSLVFWIMSNFQRAGLGPETTVKLWVCLSVGLTWGMGWLYLKQITDKILVLTLGFWLIFSPSLLFLSIEFPKMTILLALFPLVFAFAEKNQWAGAIACMTVGMLFHRGAIIFMLLTAMAMMLEKPHNGEAEAGRRWVWVAVGTLGILAWIRTHYSYLDIKRVLGIVFEPGVLTLIKRPTLPWPIKLEIGLSLLMLFVATLYRWKSATKTGRLWLPWLLVLPAFFPLGADEVMSAGERFALFLPWISFNGVIYLIPKGMKELREGLGKTAWLGLAGGFAVLSLMLPYWLETCHPKRLDPDYPSFEKVTHELVMRDIPMLVCRRDFHFFYKFKTERDAFSYEPETHWEKRRIWRLVFGVRPDEYLARVESDERGPIILPGGRYLLVREDAWEEFRGKVRWDEDSALYHLVKESWLNPSNPRPAFLYEKHRGDVKSEFDAIQTKG